MLDLTEFYPPAHNVCKVYGLEQAKLDNVRRNIEDAKKMLTSMYTSYLNKTCYSDDEIEALHVDLNSVMDKLDYALDMTRYN